MKCDICGVNEEVGCYPSPMSFLSLGYCQVCADKAAANEKTAILSFCESGLTAREGWVRHMERLEWKPTVYVNGEYVPIKKWLEEHTECKYVPIEEILKRK